MKRLIDENALGSSISAVIELLNAVAGSLKQYVDIATSITTVRGSKTDTGTFVCMVPTSILEAHVAPSDLASLKKKLNGIILPCSGDFHTLAGEGGEIKLYKTDGTSTTLDASWTLMFNKYEVD